MIYNETIHRFWDSVRGLYTVETGGYRTVALQDLQNRAGSNQSL
jgi:hypothetical protein